MKRKKIALGITLFAAVILFLSNVPATAAEDSGDFVAENGGLTKYLGSTSNKIPFKSIFTATPRLFNVSVNGKKAAMQVYTIDGSDYFKLRDLAMGLTGTGKQFEVNWDGQNNEIIILSGEAYSETGGKRSSSIDSGSKSASLSTSKVYLNNHSHEIDLPAYNIDGSNHFKLSDIGKIMDFYITYGSANTIEIDTSAGYSVTGTKIYYSENTLLSNEPVTGVKSLISADIDSDGQNETAELVVSQYAGKKWTLVYKDGDAETSVPIFKGIEFGLETSIAAGCITSKNTTDFLVSANQRSLPFGGWTYELYSFKDGIFKQIDISEITDGTDFNVSVDESHKTAKLSSYRSTKTVALSDLELSDYSLYGKEFCQDFFIEMKLQSVEGYALPDLVTTEVIAAVLPNNLTYLHTTYRYIDGVWKTQKVEFYDLDKAMSLTGDDPGKTRTDDEKYNLAQIWANAWRTRDGKPRYEIMSTAMQADFRKQQIEMSGDPDNFVIRWSSPWVERYDVAQYGDQAVITYWYMDSTASTYKGVERLTFGEEQGRTVVTACKTEIDMEELVDTSDWKTVDTGVYTFAIPNDWDANILSDSYVTFMKNGIKLGSLETLGYYPSMPISQFEGNHAETLSTKQLDGCKYPAMEALIRRTQPAAANDDSYVDELHIYLIPENSKIAYDLSFDSSLVNEKAIEIAKTFALSSGNK